MKNKVSILKTFVLENLTFIIKLAVLFIAAFVVLSSWRNNWRNKNGIKTEVEIVSFDITDIKDICKSSYLSVIFSDYATRSFNREDTKNDSTFWQRIRSNKLLFNMAFDDPEDKYLYIVRGICKLGIDFNKVEFSKEDDVIKILCPDVEVVSCELDHEIKPLKDSKRINSLKVENSAQVISELKEKNRIRILNENREKCENEIRADFVEFFELYDKSYEVEVIFGTSAN